MPDGNDKEAIGSLQPFSSTCDGMSERAAGPLAGAVRIMAQLRGPDGCPWDREQTFDSIKRYTLEEVYEVFDAIERRAWPELKDELGDLLLQVLFYAQMAADAGYFDIADVAAGLSAKLVRRHPHVFSVDGELTNAVDAATVVRNWEQIKRQEKNTGERKETFSGLDDIPRSMPAMLEATKLGSRASKVGFDWPDHNGLFSKVGEEIAELQQEISVSGTESNDRIEEEFGDLMFTLINLGRHLKIDPETALRSANAKFRARFCAMESFAGGFEALATCSPEELEQMWQQAKERVYERTGRI